MIHWWGYTEQCFCHIIEWNRKIINSTPDRILGLMKRVNRCFTCTWFYNTRTILLYSACIYRVVNIKTTLTLSILSKYFKTSRKWQKKSTLNCVISSEFIILLRRRDNKIFDHHYYWLWTCRNVYKMFKIIFIRRYLHITYCVTHNKYNK